MSALDDLAAKWPKGVFLRVNMAGLARIEGEMLTEARGYLIEVLDARIGQLIEHDAIGVLGEMLESAGARVRFRARMGGEGLGRG